MNYILDPKFVVSLPEWFTMSEFAEKMGVKWQKAKYILAEFMTAGIVERRVSNKYDDPYRQRYEYHFTGAAISVETKGNR